MIEANFMDRLPLVLVMPCYNESDCLESMFGELCERVRSSLGVLGEHWALLLIDDGSGDGTWSIIDQLCQKHAGVEGIRLAKNVGQQAAILCGYYNTNAQWVVTLDADLQDPPETIFAMLALAKQGNSIVVGHRRTRVVDGPLKRLTAWGFYRGMGLLGINQAAMKSGDFRLMSRAAVSQLLRVSRAPLFHRFTIFELGFDIAWVEFDRSHRIAGETKYTLVKMLRLAMDACSGSRSAIARLAWLCLAVQTLLSAWIALTIMLDGAMSILILAVSVQLLVASFGLVTLLLAIQNSTLRFPLYQIAQWSGDRQPMCSRSIPVQVHGESRDE